MTIPCPRCGSTTDEHHPTPAEAEALRRTKWRGFWRGFTFQRRLTPEEVIERFRQDVQRFERRS